MYGIYSPFEKKLHQMFEKKIKIITLSTAEVMFYLFLS